jgi:hypothetical protein
MPPLAAWQHRPALRRNYRRIGCLASTCAPQLGQTAANVAPHARQKRAPSRLSAWHRGHVMPGLRAFGLAKVRTITRE